MNAFIPTPENLSAIAGVLLSLGFNYIPGLAEEYASWTKQVKSLVMLGCLAVVVLGIFFLGCQGIISNVQCTNQGAEDLIWMFILAVIGNQATYLITPQTQKVETIKANRPL